MVVLLKKRLSLSQPNSNKNSLLIKSLLKMKCVMFLVLLEVKVMLEFKKDLVSLDFQERLIEVLEEWDVLVPGIHPMYYILLPDPVN